MNAYVCMINLVCKEKNWNNRNSKFPKLMIQLVSSNWLRARTHSYWWEGVPAIIRCNCPKKKQTKLTCPTNFYKIYQCSKCARHTDFFNFGLWTSCNYAIVTFIHKCKNVCEPLNYNDLYFCSGTKIIKMSLILGLLTMNFTKSSEFKCLEFYNK